MSIARSVPSQNNLLFIPRVFLLRNTVIYAQRMGRVFSQAPPPSPPPPTHHRLGPEYCIAQLSRLPTLTGGVGESPMVAIRSDGMTINTE